MNKSLDERLMPPGEYRDALNIEVSSVEGTNVGSVRNVQGNTQLTTLEYDGETIIDAVCIGAIANESKGIMYWFVHAPLNGVDMIVSYNEKIESLTYHVVSLSVLNFNPQYLITGVNIIDDLLIWTDNYNQPRKINVNRSYPMPFLGNDTITEADIALIQAPPVSAPVALLTNASGFENYIDTRFVCFAYRYKYMDGEYSALSQFSNAAFIPSEFSLSEDTFTNSGMTSVFNAVDVSFNTGSSNVVGIDLCFKLNDSNVVNVIEKFDKYEQGWIDYDDVTVKFSSNKIYTTLPESELLRVYDNVPRKAKAQTLMGNRIMFGNYVDGYDIVSEDGQPILVDYLTEAVSVPLAQDEVSNTTTSILLEPYFETPILNPTSVLSLDFSDVQIQTGDVLTMDIGFTISSTKSVGTSVTLLPTNFQNIRLSVASDANYSDAYSFLNSAHFQNTIGTVLNIQPAGNVCNGITWTDLFICGFPTPIDTAPHPDGPWMKYEYGVASTNTPILGESSIGSDIISLQFPAVKFVRDGDTPPYTRYIVQYYDISSISVEYIKADGYKNSLHSNRGYEVGIVYIDSFGRNTTALICETNSTFFDAGSCDTRNYIRTTINNVAPAWASRYKFVIKPSKGAYNIIYSKEFYTIPALAGDYWFKLEGQNQLIPRIGEKLVVKTDTVSAMSALVQVDVLDVQSQPDGFISGAPAGLYMRIAVNNFSISGTQNDFVVFETQPDEINEGIYYEGSQSFQIVNGYHFGNVQNQNALQPAIVNLDFYNCFCFGNGVEGYKVNDGITSRSLVIGNRFSAVADEDYKESRRFASITYSGVYREQSNVNKLNEFNLALANYKDIEQIFGSIQVLFGRQTDVLTLQEDKISYVLAGKNLLSDAAAGGSITSVPEVLGTQIARLEDYGIGLNPESFASYGYDKYFVDAKRGAVLKITGSSYSNDQMEVISEYGMASWFRDRFIETTDKQKLGAYDPFMDQYILAIKDEDVESPEIVVACGTFIDSSVTTEPKVFFVDAGMATGNLLFTWNIGLTAGDIEFKATFNGVVTTSGATNTSGSMNVNKTTAYPSKIKVEIIPTSGGGNFELQIDCP